MIDDEQLWPSVMVHFRESFPDRPAQTHLLMKSSMMGVSSLHSVALIPRAWRWATFVVPEHWTTMKEEVREIQRQLKPGASTRFAGLGQNEQRARKYEASWEMQVEHRMACFHTDQQCLLPWTRGGLA